MYLVGVERAFGVSRTEEVIRSVAFGLETHDRSSDTVTIRADLHGKEDEQSNYIGV